MVEINKIEKITNNKWLNLYKAYFCNKGNYGEWIFASRKKSQTPKDIATPDAVVIIPILKTKDGHKIVIIKEFKIPLQGYEIGFPSGLHDQNNLKQTIAKELKEETGLDLEVIHKISPPIYSSSGMTNESTVLAFVSVSGILSTKNNEKYENIKTMAISETELPKILNGKNGMVGGKAWPILFAINMFGIKKFLEKNFKK